MYCIQIQTLKLVSVSIHPLCCVYKAFSFVINHLFHSSVISNLAAARLSVFIDKAFN